MKRDYKDGVSTAVNFFVGTEVEKTAYYGQKTLFVVGPQPVDLIVTHAESAGVTHVFIGANHSFKACGQFYDLVEALCSRGYNVSIDCLYDEALEAAEYFDKKNRDLFSSVCIIAQVKCPKSNVLMARGNTSLKIDDISFNATNPLGVYVIPFTHDELMGYNTPWSEYSSDEVLQ